MQRVKIIYRGLVQGVGFRVAVQSIARGFPVTGWVRNEPDGSVWVEVQGSLAAIEAFQEEIGEQRYEFIEDAEIAELMVLDDEEGFDIRFW